MAQQKQQGHSTHPKIQWQWDKIRHQRQQKEMAKMLTGGALKQTRFPKNKRLVNALRIMTMNS